MAGLTNEEVNKLTQYAEENVNVSVALIQKEFDWSYSKARNGVEKLVELKLLKYDDGIFYTYVDGSEKQCDGWEEFDDLDLEEFDDEDLDEDDDDYFGKISKDNSIVSFDIKVEEKFIVKSIEMMNKLEAAANKGKKKADDNYKPKNTKLPDTYEKLPEEAKDLVSVAVKNALKLSGARFGLFEGSKRWSRLSWGSVNYDIAMTFIEGLTNAEFKRIKYILAHC